MKRIVFLLMIVANTAFGDAFTIGPDGIDSESTGLDGSSPLEGVVAIQIGHVENFRAGKYETFAGVNAFPGLPIGRTYIDILAPGEEVAVMSLGDQVFLRDGTSYAAPHVTGTVALLYQYQHQKLHEGGLGVRQVCRSNTALHNQGCPDEFSR